MEILAAILISVLQSVSFAWDYDIGSNPEADGFRLYKATTAGGPYTMVEEIADKNARTVSTMVDVDRSEFFVLRSFNSFGESSNSNEVTTGKPTPPGALNATLETN